jgi:hypothetical protein
MFLIHMRLLHPELPMAHDSLERFGGSPPGEQRFLFGDALA